MTKDFDSIGLNSQSEAEMRDGGAVQEKQTRTLTPDADFNFKS